MKQRTMLRVEQHGPLMLAILCREGGLNVLGPALLDDLLALLRDVGGRPGCRCVVLAAEGPAFLAGSDIEESLAMTRQALEDYSAKARSVALGLARAPVPVIAAVQGAAMGGGFEIALACDFILAAAGARFGLPEARLGVMPGMGGTYLLPRAVGLRRARELLFSGASITAEEGCAAGFVNRVCAAPDLLPQALEAGHAIAARGPLAVRAIKAALHETEDVGLAHALEIEWSHRRDLLDSADRAEGMRAFLERRPPRFAGT